MSYTAPNQYDRSIWQQILTGLERMIGACFVKGADVADVRLARSEKLYLYIGGVAYQQASVSLGALTVATLPAAATAGAGARASVTDATVTTFNSVVVGAGTNKVPVWSDGTAWRIG